MRLAELQPSWLGAGGEGITDAEGKPVPERHGIGIVFDCPCGRCDEYNRVAVCFENPLDGKPPRQDRRSLWRRQGETFETLTLHPSIRRVGGCGWHGFVTNGEVSTV